MKASLVVVPAVGASCLALLLQAQDASSVPPAAPDAAADPAPASAPSLPIAPPDQPPLPTQTGKVEKVTLYQGTALVTRRVEIPAEYTGVFEVVVSPLPSATEATSVYADEASGVVVRSAVCRVRPYDEQETLNQQVGQLDARIQELERQMADNRNEIALRRIRQEYLRGLESFVGPAVDAEMAHGVIQADQILAVTQMHFTEYEKASQEVLRLDFANQDLTQQLQRARDERQRLAAGPPVQYDAVLLVEKAAAEPATLQLNYLVQGCGWTPLYNLRGNSADHSVQLDLNAQISQVSGEDWSEVALRLSTARPMVSAFNPRLTAMSVALQPEAMAGVDGPIPQSSASNLAAQQQAQTRRDEFFYARGTSIGDQAGNMFNANRSATELQLLELASAPGAGEANVSLSADPSIEYALDQRVTLVSRRDAQVVPVSSRQAPADFYHVAVPVLTENVYREAMMTNDTDQDLLGGAVQVYLDGRFVGRTEVPTLARGRSYPVGFGVDGQLRARRELVERTETVQGANQRVEVEVALTLDNFAGEPARVHVRERLPWMQDDASLKVRLESTERPLSTDAEYIASEQPRNILLWETDLPPGAGDQATRWNYSYTLEYDRNLALRDVQGAEVSRQLQDFVDEANAAAK